MGVTAKGGRIRPGTSTTVSTTAVSLLPANHARKGLIISETGGQAIRFLDDDTDLAATRGVYLAASSTMILWDPYCPTGPIWAIRVGGTDGAVTCSEVEA